MNLVQISIVIVSYNTKELLKKCLEAIIDSCTDTKMQTCLPARQGCKVEIIIVDNGSKDGSVGEIQNSKCKMQNDKLKLKIIENKENLGFARAVNQALSGAHGRAILLLNSDTQVEKEALRKLLGFEEKVGPAVIGTRLLNPDGSVQPSVFHLPTIKRAIWEFWLGKKGAFSKYVPEGKKPTEVEAVSGGAMLISRGVIGKIGLFDERYFMYFEDLDYCRRARLAGFKVYYLPTAEIVHEHGASGKEIVDEANQWRRLIPSSKIYHGGLRHQLINLILWTGQKWKKVLKLLKL